MLTIQAAKFNLREFGSVLSINNSKKNTIPSTKEGKGGKNPQLFILSSQCKANQSHSFSRAQQWLSECQSTGCLSCH
jgi:hypothetical protein